MQGKDVRDSRTEVKTHEEKIVVFMVASALLAAGSVAVAQQTPPVRRIGYLTLKAMVSSLAFSEIFRQGLRELGYVEGQNIVIEYRRSLS